jgi:hypothetical protein
MVLRAAPDALSRALAAQLQVMPLLIPGFN